MEKLRVDKPTKYNKKVNKSQNEEPSNLAIAGK